MLSEDDISLLAAAQALELSARDIYASAVSRKSRSEEEQGLLELMHSHHTAYEQTLNGVLSKRAATERNADAYTKFFALLSDSSKLWSTLLELENTAIATHTQRSSRGLLQPNTPRYSLQSPQSKRVMRPCSPR